MRNINRIIKNDVDFVRDHRDFVYGITSSGNSTVNNRIVIGLIIRRP